MKYLIEATGKVGKGDYADQILNLPELAQYFCAGFVKVVKVKEK